MKRDSAPTNNLWMKNGRMRAWVVPLIVILAASFFMVNGVRQLTATFQYHQNPLSQSDADLGIDADARESQEITSVALFGVDSREGGFKGLSDSIMIITADFEHKSLKLVSVMRDSLVKVEGHGVQKINAAYNLGGAQLAVKTLNQIFGLNIRNYATVDFSSMESLVEAVGGVEVELTPTELETLNFSVAIRYSERGESPQLIPAAGKQRLNGIQAVVYSRIRSVATPGGANNDFGRTERQRAVMNQLFQKALDRGVTGYPALIKAALPYIETSLGYGDILKLAGILSAEGLTFTQARMPANQMIIDADFRPRSLGSCVYYNLDYAAGMMQDFIYEDIPFETYMDEHPVDLTRWYGA